MPVADGRAAGYADAVLAVARAEGDEAGVTDELFRFAQALRASNELRTALTDGAVEPARRQQIVEDLLGGRARPATAALVSLVVGAGRGGELPEIIDAAVDRAAADRNRTVARVRSAVALTDDQQARLAAALRSATGTDIEVRVIVDPAVIGGVITEIGDDVIDGSVRSRLGQMRAGLA